MTRPCTRCCAVLPLRKFPLVNGKPQARCSPCANSDRRLRDPLPAVKRDPREVHISNTFNLWHHPVGPVLLRSIA